MRCFELRELDDRVNFRIIGFISVSDSEFFDSEFLDSECLDSEFLDTDFLDSAIFDSELFGSFLVPFFSIIAFFAGGESFPLDSESEPLLN